MSNKVITIRAEAQFGCSGMSDAEAAIWAIEKFLEELKVGNGIDKMRIIIDDMGSDDE